LHRLAVAGGLLPLTISGVVNTGLSAILHKGQTYKLSTLIQIFQNSKTGKAKIGEKKIENLIYKSNY